MAAWPGMKWVWHEMDNTCDKWIWSYYDEWNDNMTEIWSMAQFLFSSLSLTSVDTATKQSPDIMNQGYP